MWENLRAKTVAMVKRIFASCVWVFVIVDFKQKRLNIQLNERHRVG